MKKNNIINFAVAISLFFAFVVFTILVKFVDTDAIGVNNTIVGLAKFNGWAHNLIGVNFTLYNITDWLGILVVLVALGFAVLGLVQLIKRKSFLKIDHSVLVLGAFYIVVFVAYAFFELVVINYRPVLIEGKAESSYPSSTTMLMLTVLPTAMMQFCRLIKSKPIKITVNIVCGVILVFSVVGRIVSGVHWMTDIIGGILLSAALVTLYYAFVKFFDYKKV